MSTFLVLFLKHKKILCTSTWEGPKRRANHVKDIATLLRKLLVKFSYVIARAMKGEGLDEKNLLNNFRDTHL